MNEAQKIGKFMVKNVATSEMAAVETFWASQPCVITFLRRFGCAFCRLGAKQMSTLKPILDENNVRFIGIGLEEFGVEDFVAGEYFSGELYIDAKKSCYESLGYKRYNILSIFPAILAKKSRDYLHQTKIEGISGNLKGDGLQTGGTLVVAAGGEAVLLNFKQDNPADHVENGDILKALNISAPLPQPKAEEKQASPTAGNETTCST